MHSMRNDASPVKFNLVSVVMCGILGVSMVLAWLTTKHQRLVTPDDAEVISKLAADKLDGYWGDSRSDSWFIVIKPDLTPVGWQMLSRGVDPKGGFAGSLIDKMGSKGPQACTWRLSNDLSEGLYLANGPDPNDEGKQVKTRIAMSDSEVTVVRTIGGKKITATAPRPDNYVPEGAFPLVLRIVSERGKEATVKMIFDDMAIVHGNINFISAKLIPHGDKVVQVEYSIGRSVSTVAYQLDPDRNISRYEYAARKTIYLRCEKELITKSFKFPDTRPAIKARP